MKKENAVEYIIKQMREKGFKATPTRICIVKLLARAKRPLSADEIYDQVSDTVNRVTVYRTLATLEDADCVTHFTFQNKHVYELTTRHNHYLVCRECDRFERISFCSLDTIEENSLRSSKHFASIDHHTLQLSGICRDCVQ